MKISKELLSEVLGFEVSEVNIYNDLVVYSKKLNNNFSTDFSGLDISVYELAFKLKDWCNTQSYYISSGYDEKYYCMLRDMPDNQWFYAETEVEAIILASEWVLKEINEKQLQH